MLSRSIFGNLKGCLKHQQHQRPISFLIQNSNLNYQKSKFFSTLNQDDDFSIISNKTSELNQQVDLPLLINRQLKHPEMFNPKITPPKEAWIEDFTNKNPQKLAIVKLHPTIFSHFPRTDFIQRNVEWQKNIHWVNYLSVKVRNELPDSTKKPWPQKGQGKISLNIYMYVKQSLMFH